MSQPLVLAIEPDPRQAAIIKRIVREKALADVAVVDSRDAAIEAMRTSMPDVLLLTALFSPRDEDELMGHLRTLDNAGHLQTHTIPQLASSLGPAEGRSRGLFSAFRKKKDTDQPVAGCDPDLFAEEIRVYLQRAADKKRELENSAEAGVAGAAVRESWKTSAEKKKASDAAAEAESAPAESSSWESPFEWKPTASRSPRSAPAPTPTAATPPPPATAPAEAPSEPALVYAQDPIADAPLVEEPMAPVPLSTAPVLAEPLIVEPVLVQPRAVEPLIRAPYGDTSTSDGSTDDRTIEYPVNDPWVVHAPRQITIAPDAPIVAAPPMNLDSTPLIPEIPPAAFEPTPVVEPEPLFVEAVAPPVEPIRYAEPEPEPEFIAEPEPIAARAEEPVPEVLEAAEAEPSHTPVHERAVRIVARLHDEQPGSLAAASRSDTEWTHDPRPAAARAGERLGPLARWARAEAGRKPKSEGVTADDVRALIASLAVPVAVASVTYPKGCRIRRVRVPPAPDGEGGESVGAVILSRRALADERGKQTTA